MQCKHLPNQCQGGSNCKHSKRVIGSPRVGLELTCSLQKVSLFRSAEHKQVTEGTMQPLADAGVTKGELLPVCSSNHMWLFKTSSRTSEGWKARAASMAPRTPPDVTGKHIQRLSKGPPVDQGGSESCSGWQQCQGNCPLPPAVHQASLRLHCDGS